MPWSETQKGVVPKNETPQGFQQGRVGYLGEPRDVRNQVRLSIVGGLGQPGGVRKARQWPRRLV